MDFNARIELDSTDLNEVAIDALIELVDQYTVLSPGPFTAAASS